MKNTFKTLFLASMIAASFTSYGQAWNTSGNALQSIPLPKLGSTDATDLPFYTNDNQTMTLTANGWLGVGTTIPDGWEEVFYTPTNSRGDNGLLVTLNSTNPSGITYDVMSPDLIGGGLVYDVTPSGGGGETGGGGTNATFTLPFSFRTGHLTTVAFPLYSPVEKPMFWVREKNPPHMNSATGLEEYDTKFIVMPDGSCGINITNPRAALDVRGSQAPNRPAAIIGSRALGTNVTDGATMLDQYYTQMVQFVPVLKENGYNEISQKDDQGMFFTDGMGIDGANGSGSFVLAPWSENQDPDVGGMRMDKFGNTEFHGTLRATKMNVDARWWPDFVFAEDYELRSIEEVATFIDKNKHLPDVPSEKEVLENGIDIGEMQSIQQKKIEELTLYTIQQQKQIDALLAAIEELKK